MTLTLKRWLEEETNNEYQNLDDFIDALVNGKVLCQLAFKYYPKLASNWKPRYQISERNTVYLNAFFHFLDFIGMFTVCLCYNYIHALTLSAISLRDERFS